MLVFLSVFYMSSYIMTGVHDNDVDNDKERFELISSSFLLPRCYNIHEKRLVAQL